VVWVAVVVGGVVVVAVEGDPTEGRGAVDVVDDVVMVMIIGRYTCQPNIEPAALKFNCIWDLTRE
jgi:hypothetical protein